MSGIRRNSRSSPRSREVSQNLARDSLSSGMYTRWLACWVRWQLAVLLRRQDAWVILRNSRNWSLQMPPRPSDCWKTNQRGKVDRNPLSALNSPGSWCKRKPNLIYCASLRFDLGMTGMDDSWFVYLQGLVWRSLIFKLTSFRILMSWWVRSWGRSDRNLDDMTCQIMGRNRFLKD